MADVRPPDLVRFGRFELDLANGLSIAATMPAERELWSMRELWVMDTQGGNARKLLDAGDLTSFESVQWSPDGTTLLFLRDHENGVRKSVEILDIKSGEIALSSRIRSLANSIGCATAVSCTRCQI